MVFKKLAFFLVFLLASVVYAKEPINLIWLGGGPEGSWEEDWIHEMLSEVKADFQTIVDIDHAVFLDRSIIVSSAPNMEKYKQYFSEYSKRNLRFGIIHISDEGYSHPCDFYQYAQFIVRNYWHKKFAGQKNLLFFPLGYKRKFWHSFQGELKPSFSRKFTWSFAGQISKSSRISMIGNMKKIPGYFIHETSTFNAPECLPIAAYRDLMLESIFMPCPRGWWNLDSFRLSEALECGCIPIVEKTPFDYFAKLFDGPYPFLAVENWEEVPHLMKTLLADPERLEQLRLDCYHWWLEYKKNLEKKIADLVEDALN